MDTQVSPTPQRVTVVNTNLPVVEYQGQRVLTLSMIDQAHERPTGTAKRNFWQNRKHFTQGEDFFLVCADEIRAHKICEISAMTREDIYLLTFHGYLLLAKSLTDDRAWRVQRCLVDSYFERGQALPALPGQPTNTLLLADQRVRELEAQVNAMRPMAEFYEAVTASPGSMSMNQVAKVLEMEGIGRNRLFRILREKQVLFRENGVNVPYDRYMHRGLFEVVFADVVMNGEAMCIGVKTLVKPKGMDFIRRLLRDDARD